MSYEEAETIKTIVLIILCIPPIVVLIVKDIISTIEERKYREELQRKYDYYNTEKKIEKG